MTPQDNAVLARLDDASFARLAPFLELIKLRSGQLLHDAGEPVRYLYFPAGAVVGLRCELDSGEWADFGMLDRLLCGPLHVLVGDTSITSAVVRHAGPCYRLPISVFKSEMRHSDSIFNEVMRTFRNTVHQMGLMSVCLRKHPIENMVAAWLLISTVVTRSGLLRVTHRDIAQSLGVRREAVSMTLKKYASHALIEQARGNIHVANPEGLKRWSCTCYGQWVQCMSSELPTRLLAP